MHVRILYQLLEGKAIISFIKSIPIFFLHLLFATAIVFCQKYTVYRGETGANFLFFIQENLSLILFLTTFIYIPVFFSKTRIKSALITIFVTIFLFPCLFFSSIFFPGHLFSPYIPELETEKFYESESSFIFSENIGGKKFIGIIIPKKGRTGSTISKLENPILEQYMPKPAEIYQGKYILNREDKLKITGKNEVFSIEKKEKNNFNEFFNSILKYLSIIPVSIGKSGIKDIIGTLIKITAVLAVVFTISHYFSSGRWPILNYFFSQFFIVVFLFVNYKIQQIPLPDFFTSAVEFLKSESTIYYLFFLILSVVFLPVLIKHKKSTISSERKKWN